MIDAAILGNTYADIAAFVVVVGMLGAAWKLIGRGAEGIVLFNKKIVPNVQYMDLLPKLDAILTILEEVVGQVRTDSGSSIKDTTIRLEETMERLASALERLEGYAQENRTAAADAAAAAAEAKDAVIVATAAAVRASQTNAEGITALKVLMGTAKERASDAAGLARDDRDLARDALEEIKKLLASATRTEESGARVEAASALVAEDLAAKQDRADAVHGDEPPGTASDAASQSPDGE